MSATGKRSSTITYTGDVGGTTEIEAADNSSSPAQIENKALSSGNNTITVPTGATACTIMKASDNTTAVTLKGVAGDTGVRLHNTDPDSISLHSSQATFVLNAGASMTVRLFWT